MPAMTTPQKQIEQQVQAALKASDRDRLDTLRMLLSAIQNERIRTGAEVDEETLWSLARKGIKQRRESSEQYRSGGRDDLADKEDREAEILAEFLPPAVDEEELTKAISAARRGLVTTSSTAEPASMTALRRATDALDPTTV